MLEQFLYYHGGWSTVKNKGAPYIIAGMTGITDLGKPRVQGQSRQMAGSRDVNRSGSASSINRTPRFEGASQTTLTRIDKILETSQNTSKGSGVTNYTQKSGRSRNSDFAWLSTNGTVITQNNRVTVVQLNDGTKLIKRPSGTGPMTIEIQKSNGVKVMEIRYDTP